MLALQVAAAGAIVELDLEELDLVEVCLFVVVCLVVVCVTYNTVCISDRDSMRVFKSVEIP